MATLGEERPSLAEGVSARLRESNLHDFKQQELSIIVWAFAVFGAPPRSCAELLPSSSW